MSKSLHHRLTAASLVLCLAVLTFAPAVAQNSSTPITVDNTYGAGFWSDPCTWDGFAVGAGLVTQNWVAVSIGLLKAWRLDDCF